MPERQQAGGLAQTLNRQGKGNMTHNKGNQDRIARRKSCNAQ
jgi:hypothetical protein